MESGHQQQTVKEPGIHKNTHKYTIGNVTRMVSRLCGIPVDILRSKSQCKKVACARYICFHFIRDLVPYINNRGNKYPYKKIGEYFNRDHSTVITGRETLKDMLLTNEEMYVTLMERVKNKIAEQQSKN